MGSEGRIEELASELGLGASAETVADSVAHVEELSDYLESERRDRGDSQGRRSDDEYNALLDVYDEPRQRTSSGPLSGLRFVVKDNIAVKGLTMTCGSKSFATVPAHDATVVDRILDAGGRVVGKANMDAFAFGPGGLWSELGQVRNPLAGDRIPGGTSSGCGVAVAAGLADAALGSDTGGSVRSPAACCGIVGIKPTHSLVSRYGLVENVRSADTIGPLARDVETAARVLEVMRGPDPRDPSVTSTEGVPLDRGLDQFDTMTIGFLDLDRHGVSETVTDAMADLAVTLAAHEDVTVGAVDLDMTAVEEAYTVISGTEFAWLLRQSGVPRSGAPVHPDVAAVGDRATFNDHIAERVLPGAYLDAATDGRAYARAQEEVLAFRRELDDVFDRFDVLLTPTLRSLPPKPKRLRSTKGGFTYTIAKQFSLVGLPAVSLPFADHDGLPVSAQVLAPRFDDRTAITAGRLVERLSADS